MDDLNFTHFGFIGFGLIGGSVAHALREQYPEADLTAYNYYETKPHPMLNKAKEDGILSQVSTDLAAFSKCDVIFLCAPVLTNITYLEKLKPYLSENCLLTDVGSVKSDIVAAIKKAGLEKQFVGGHPMTGSEKIGYTYSSSSFFVDKYYLLTPTPETRPEYTAWMTQFVKRIGSRCMILDPLKHDAIVAGISHVPHVISAALVNSVAVLDNDGTYGALAAGGFHSVTRISSSSPKMWQNICLTNAEQICTFLEQFTDLLTDMKQKIEAHDEEALMDFFVQAKKYRDRIIQ